MKQKEHPIWHSFVRSNYITAFWNWFLMLAGKAAEAVLTASVIYSCARLLPTIHPPVWLDNMIFVCQMVALDVGGLSLRKMANLARQDGNEDGALFAGRVSNALIAIMVANVVLSALQSVTPISAQAVSACEGALLVARAVMAVLYATVIHSLKSGGMEQQDVMDAHDQMQEKLDAFATQMDERFAAISEMIQPVSYDDLMKQVNTRIAETVERSEHLAKQANSETLPVSSKRETPKGETPKRVPRNTQNIVPLPARETGQRNTKEVIYALLVEDETRGPRELGRLANVAPATAKRHRDAYLAEQSEHSETLEIKQPAM